MVAFWYLYAIKLCSGVYPSPTFLSCPLSLSLSSSRLSFYFHVSWIPSPSFPSPFPWDHFLLFYITWFLWGVWICVWCMYAHMCVGAHVCMCIWKPNVYVDIHVIIITLHLITETGPLAEHKKESRFTSEIPVFASQVLRFQGATTPSWLFHRR